MVQPVRLRSARFVRASALVSVLSALGCSSVKGSTPSRLASSSSCPTATFTSQDEAQVRAVLARQRDAWNAGDLVGYMDGYEHSDALVFTSGAKIRRGWQATHDKYQRRYGSDPATMGHLEFDLDEVRALGADAAVVLGHWRLTDTPQGGEGVFSVIVLRGSDGWRVVHDHTSASASDAKPSSAASTPATDDAALN